MAMKFCKECSAEISKSAKICPKCGKKQKRGGFFRVLLGIFILIIGVALLAGDTSTPTPTSTSTNTEKFTLVSDKMTTEYGTSYIEGEIKNNTDKTYNYVQVTFNLYDKSGAQLGTAVDNINNLEPNGTWKYKALGLTTEKVDSYKFVEISGW